MKVLVTGGAGFIGSNLALKLMSIGHEVVVMDNLSEQIHGDAPELTSPLYQNIQNSDVSFFKGDVCIRKEWEKVLNGIEVIVHLAAETGTGQSMYEIERYTRVNTGGTSVMLDMLANRKHSVQKVVIASSRAIYGEGKYFSEESGFVYPDQRKPEDMSKGDFEVKCKGCKSPLTITATDEDSRIHPSSIYGITKQNQEQLVMCVCKSLNIDAVALRYQNVYGPGQSLKNPYTGILSIFSTLIKTHKPLNIFEDGKESRDFVYIDDVVNATILAIGKEEANGEILNVGTGVPTNVLSVAQSLVNNYNIEVPIHITGNFRIGDIRHNFADLTKINKLLGYNPAVDFERGIRSFVNWVNEQEITESKFNDSVGEMKSRGLLK
jgi:dTDP-L-rhamnose 4-epimerase